MAQQILTIGETGQNALNAINNNFTELYGALVIPIKIIGATATRTQAILANTFVSKIFLSATSGNPTLRIGTTPNGVDIMPDTVIGNMNEVDWSNYYLNAGTIYFTWSIGPGTVNIRINVLTNFY